MWIVFFEGSRFKVQKGERKPGDFGFPLFSEKSTFPVSHHAARKQPTFWEEADGFLSHQGWEIQRKAPWGTGNQTSCACVFGGYPRLVKRKGKPRFWGGGSILTHTIPSKRGPPSSAQPSGKFRQPEVSSRKLEQRKAARTLPSRIHLEELTEVCH